MLMVNLKVESVIFEMGNRLPLERVLNLPESQTWCTDELLSTIAIDRGMFRSNCGISLKWFAQGFLTAKAARPDIYRAGAIIVRSFQSSEIPWAFRPSNDNAEEPRNGIWLPDFKRDGGGTELRDAQTETELSNISSPESERAGSSSDESGITEEDGEDGRLNEPQPTAVANPFGLLHHADGESSSEPDESADSEAHLS